MLITSESTSPPESVARRLISKAHSEGTEKVCIFLDNDQGMVTYDGCEECLCPADLIDVIVERVLNFANGSILLAEFEDGTTSEWEIESESSRAKLKLKRT